MDYLFGSGRPEPSYPMAPSTPKPVPNAKSPPPVRESRVVPPKRPTAEETIENLVGRLGKARLEVSLLEEQLEKARGTAVHLSGPSSASMVPIGLRPSSTDIDKIRQFEEKLQSQPPLLFLNAAYQTNTRKLMEESRKALESGNPSLAYAYLGVGLERHPPAIHTYAVGEPVLFGPKDRQLVSDAAKARESVSALTSEATKLIAELKEFSERIKPGGSENVPSADKVTLTGFKKTLDPILEKGRDLDANLLDLARAIEQRVVDLTRREPSPNSQGTYEHYGLVPLAEFQIRLDMVKTEQQERRKVIDTLQRAHEGLGKTLSQLTEEFNSVDLFVNPQPGVMQITGQYLWNGITWWTGSGNSGLSEKAEANT